MTLISIILIICLILRNQLDTEQVDMLLMRCMQYLVFKRVEMLFSLQKYDDEIQ